MIPLAGSSRAVGHVRRGSPSSLFDDLSLNGQFNLITTTSFDRPQDLFSMNVDLPKSVAFVSLEAPGAQRRLDDARHHHAGGLVVVDSGRLLHRANGNDHAYEAGVSYACSDTWAATATRWPRCATAAGTLALYAFDTWQIARPVVAATGAKYARYDYLTDRGSVESACQHCVATDAAGQPDAARVDVAPRRWHRVPKSSCRLRSVCGYLPSGRSRRSRAAVFHPERHDQVEVGVERTWPGDIVVGVRVFDQRVENQLVTVFGVGLADVADGVGHRATTRSDRPAGMTRADGA